MGVMNVTEIWEIDLFGVWSSIDLFGVWSSIE